MCGMATGSFLSGRLAGKVDTTWLVDRAMAFLLLAAAVNVTLTAAVTLWGALPPLPWSVVGPTLLGLALGVFFPVLQLALLDQFPHHRGAAASMSAFIVLMFNVLLAGVVAPLVTASLLTAALASAILSVLGVLFWVWHRRATRPAV